MSGSREVTMGRNPGPAYGMAVLFRDHTGPTGAQECVFRLFHIGEECREMHDPCGIGVTEFDAPLNGKNLRHVCGGSVCVDAYWRIS